MYRVLVADHLAEGGIDVLRRASGFQVDARKGIDRRELLEIVGQYHAILVRSRTRIDQELLARAHALSVIGRAGVSLARIDVEAATAAGVAVTIAPDGNARSTAEHTIGLLLSISRRIPHADASLRRGRWDRARFMGVEIGGKRLGVIGMGRVGREVARLATGLGMRVLAVDPALSEERASSLGVEKVSLAGLYDRSDFITVHVPRNRHTDRLIDASAFERMRNGVRLINCSAGGVVVEQDLYEALVGGKVAAAALDVFEEEPPFGNPLLSLPNVVATPHIAASTFEAQGRVAVEVAEQVRDYLREGRMRNVINRRSLNGESSSGSWVLRDGSQSNE